VSGQQTSADVVTPRVSVVVSTYNRADSLPQLIAALENQEGVQPFEAVIVDDCSTDRTPEALRELVQRTRFPLRVLQTSVNSGPATGRNLGWRAARAPLIAFTDDDCRPDPAWLVRLIAALERADVVQGQTRVDPVELGGVGPFARVQVIEEWSGLFECCNVGYRREVLERIGGFDESFPRPFGEDVDLGWRAVELGASVAWAPEVLVVHDVETSGNRLRDWALWMKDIRRRVYAALMVKKHPGLRTQLHRRWFYKPHHPRTLAALVGLGIIATGPSGRLRWLAAAASIAPWLHYRAVVDPRPARRRNYPVVLPLTFIGDAADVGVMLVGSIRFRTILL
jgi:GT2 family glycosyltransferase